MKKMNNPVSLIAKGIAATAFVALTILNTFLFIKKDDKTLSLSLTILEAKANDDGESGGGAQKNKRIVPTDCQEYINGRWVTVGHANDCDSGTSYCTDTSC